MQQHSQAAAYDLAAHLMMDQTALKTVGVWSMFQHASGHPEAAACVPYHPKTDY